MIAFLDELQQQIAGRLLVIWDGAPIHRSRAVKKYLADGAAARLHLERLLWSVCSGASAGLRAGVEPG